MPPSARYRRAVRSVDPGDLVLTALELTHPVAAEPVRVVNDTEERTIEGNSYVGLPFGVQWPAQGQARPAARIWVDNVGRDLTQWIEASQGFLAGRVRVMQVLAETGDVEQEITLDASGATVEQDVVTFDLGIDAVLDAPVVALVHDPESSPGLF